MHVWVIGYTCQFVFMVLRGFSCIFVHVNLSGLDVWMPALCSEISLWSIPVELQSRVVLLCVCVALCMSRRWCVSMSGVLDRTHGFLDLGRFLLFDFGIPASVVELRRTALCDRVHLTVCVPLSLSVASVSALDFLLSLVCC